MIFKRAQRAIALALFRPMLRRYAREPLHSPEHMDELHRMGEELSPLERAGLLWIYAGMCAVVCGSSCGPTKPGDLPRSGGETIH